MPELSRILGISIDEIVAGRKDEPIVTVLPEGQRKDIDQLTLRIICESADGDHVKVNLPMALVKLILESGMATPEMNGMDALKHIDLAQIFTLVENGAVGNLVECESADGDIVRIFVE